MTQFNVIIKKSWKRKKSIAMRVNAMGEVVVSAPVFTTKKTIEKFINEREDWIIAHIEKIKKKANKSPKLFGDEVVIKIEKSAIIRKGGFHKISGGEVVIVAPKTAKSDKKIIDEWFKNFALEYLTQRTEYYSKLMGLEYRKIFVREQKTRWGSCDYKNNIRYNWRVIEHAKPVIDYLVVHELSHVKHKNHSAEFWGLVAKFCPEYKTLRACLKGS